MDGEPEAGGRYVYAGYDARNRLVGVALEAAGQGFQDTIRFIYGYSPEKQAVVGFVVLESMASGLPIACAERSSLPEVLGEAAVYFDPEDPASIAQALREMLGSERRRTDLAENAHARSRSFTWERCADDTMRFITHAATTGR